MLSYLPFLLQGPFRNCSTMALRSLGFSLGTGYKCLGPMRREFLGSLGLLYRRGLLNGFSGVPCQLLGPLVSPVLEAPKDKWLL